MYLFTSSAFTCAFSDIASCSSTGVRSTRARQTRRGAVAVLVAVSGTVNTLPASTVSTRWTRVYINHINNFTANSDQSVKYKYSFSTKHLPLIFNCFIVTVVPRARSTRFGSRRFSVCGPPIWNKLPQHLRNTDTKEQLSVAL